MICLFTFNFNLFDPIFEVLVINIFSMKRLQLNPETIDALANKVETLLERIVDSIFSPCKFLINTIHQGFKVTHCSVEVTWVPFLALLRVRDCFIKQIKPMSLTKSTKTPSTGAKIVTPMKAILNMLTVNSSIPLSNP